MMTDIVLLTGSSFKLNVSHFQQKSLMPYIFTIKPRIITIYTAKTPAISEPQLQHILNIKNFYAHRSFCKLQF